MLKNGDQVAATFSKFLFPSFLDSMYWLFFKSPRRFIWYTVQRRGYEKWERYQLEGSAAISVTKILKAIELKNL